MNSVLMRSIKSDKKIIARIQAAVEAAKEQGKSKKWGGKLPPKEFYFYKPDNSDTEITTKAT